MDANEMYMGLHEMLNHLSQLAITFHGVHPRVVTFWEWNFREYLNKQKLNPRKKRRIAKWQKIKRLITKFPVRGIINASCGNIREFIEFLEQHVSSSNLKHQLLLNFDVVPAVMEHNNKILESKGWALETSEKHHFQWAHPIIDDFKVINALGDANAFLILLNERKLIRLLGSWGLMWLDGIGNVIPIISSQKPTIFNQNWLYQFKFLEIFKYFKWTHVTWLYLSENGHSLVTKLKFYKNVLWRAAPTLFYDLTLIVLNESKQQQEQILLERVPFEELDETTTLGLKHDLQAIQPLSSATVEVHDSQGSISYVAQFVSPTYLARQLNLMIEEEVTLRIDELVYPEPKVYLEGGHFIKTFYTQTIRT